MHLTPFILILGILSQIILSPYAIPLTREQTGVVTLPLKRTPVRRDLHPLMVRPLGSCPSNAYCDTIKQLIQMHKVRAQRRLARMRGRAVSSVEEVNQLTARGTRIGYAGGKQLNNNDLNVSSTCEFLTFVLISLSSRSAQRNF